ncbi:methyltransferase domain-containing protein [Pedobacter sp. HMF7647]|uniref:Methyltransferase domain-containing protein n=1 Tax=Hufsiella arboris TaxID=2695275 RepID=A0A7K1YD89_9SPHI|nr:class I SAM-dependent methyltransferase [Hufsiella arboris]MXV52059.1 methyltransferase domain-containing protein [Hufsiella arboris]
MQNNYDPVASFYDPLSRLVFGRKLIQAQVAFLKCISPGSAVLIAGGGTGWILEEITRIHQSGLTIVYVELSANMLKKSAERNTGGNSVRFVESSIQDFNSATKFDVIITSFLFDNFSAETGAFVFAHLNKMLKNNGQWLYADFNTEKNSIIWKTLLLKSMYFFFRLFFEIEGVNPLDAQALFVKYNFLLQGKKNFYAGFIESLVYQKS